MKKTIFIIFLSVYTTLEIVAQNYRLPILKGINSESFIFDMSVIKKNKTLNEEDSLISLKNGIEVSNYKIFERSIQNFEPSKYNTITFLVAYMNDEMIMVVDNNHNANLSDDSVYTFVPKEIITTNKNFKNSLPQIRLDSIEIINVKGDKEYYSTDIRFCPSLKFGKLFSGYPNVLKDKEMNLLIFSDSFYLTPPFLINDIYYHLEIIPHPFIYSVYPVNNSNFSKTNIALVKHISKDSFTMVGFQVIEYMLTNNKEMNFENQTFKLKSYNFSSKSIEFEIETILTNSDSTLSHFDTFKYQSIKDKKMHLISISKKKYTVIEFGGSWCKPCNEIIPQIEKFNLIKGDSINFISIFKESNLANAIRYYKFIKPKWNAYYEPLKCDKQECLSKFFDVGVYPVIILLDSKGSLLFRANGSNCVNELELFLRLSQPKKDI